MSGTALLSIPAAVACLRNGKLIAYPTEAVYGLGCDPANEAATRQLLVLKKRPAGAGLILISDRFDRFEPYVRPVSLAQKERVLATWPGPVTWLFPRRDTVPGWLAGTHDTIALRVTAHPVCRELCKAFGGPVVSTSANPTGQEPARSVADVTRYFGNELCGTVDGDLGDEEGPSEIRDLVSGRILRKK